MEEIRHIFSRQYKRMENELKQVNCPTIYIDCFSKYFKFLNQDVNEAIINNFVKKEKGNETNYNKK